MFLLTIQLYSQSEPSWINNYPVDELYYTGIGSSNGGNKSSDYEKALIQARLNLAAEISTTIQAETQIITRDSSSGGFSDTFTEKLSQSVEQHLKELEIVDTFYSRNQGYWVYIRLNKIRWHEFQAEEMYLLLNRIQHILNEDYFNNRATTADKLFKLGSVATILEESPYKVLLKGDLGITFSGNIFDFVQSEIYKISTSLSITTEKTEYSAQSGETIELKFTVNSTDSYTGKIPIKISYNNESIYEAFSDINGRFRVLLQSKNFNNGRNTLNITMASAALGFPENSQFLNTLLLETEGISLTVRSPSIYLQFNSNRNDLEFLKEPLETLFSTGEENFTLTDLPSETNYEMTITLNFTDYPPVLNNAPLMAGLSCIISLKKENKVLYEYKTRTIKDGGLSSEQAYQRVFNKLISQLENDRSYISRIETEITR